MGTPKMPPLSLKKIFLAVLGVLVLIHRRAMVNALEPFGVWFRDSLLGFSDFPKGAQSAIAFFSLVLIAVLISNYRQK
mgnify:CR=1 FL=1